MLHELISEDFQRFTVLSQIGAYEVIDNDGTGVASADDYARAEQIAGYLNQAASAGQDDLEIALESI